MVLFWHSRDNPAGLGAGLAATALMGIMVMHVRIFELVHAVTENLVVASKNKHPVEL